MVKQTKNGLHDIPGYDGMEDEAFPPLPPPHSPGLGREDEGDPFATGEEEGDVSKLEEVPAAKRKGVKRPQPKLDSNRLTSERGLPALRTLFDSVHFKGKGHEAENLRLLMQKMENWAHRLFPKLQFEDFIDKVEKLGNKKEVQTCLKRIRLDMPLTHEDFMGEEEEAAPDSNIFGEPDPFSRGSFTDEPIHSTPAPAAPPTPAATPSSPAAASPSLTEEQRKRMELNRQRALERRLARQQQKTEPSDSQPADASLLADEPSSVSSANVLDNSKDQQQEEQEKEQEEEEKEEKEEKEVVEEEKEKDLDLQPVSSSTQQPDQFSPKDSEPPTPCETAESSNSPVNQPTNSCEVED